MGELVQNDVFIGIYLVSSWHDRLRTILERLEVPFSHQDGMQELWNILRLVLKEWQRPWVLLLHFPMTLDEVTEVVMRNLPRSRYGTVILAMGSNFSAASAHAADAINFTKNRLFNKLLRNTERAYYEDYDEIQDRTDVIFDDTNPNVRERGAAWEIEDGAMMVRGGLFDGWVEWVNKALGVSGFGD